MRRDRGQKRSAAGLGPIRLLWHLVLVLRGSETESLTTCLSSRDLKGTMDVSVGRRGTRLEPGASPPRAVRPPEKEEVDLSGWDSLEMTPVLRWPCPYEVTF